MFMDRLGDFLQDRCGLNAEDVPPVLGTFISVKYTTWAVFIAAGVRWRPLSRVFTTRVVPKVKEAAPRIAARVKENLTAGGVEKMEKHAGRLRKAKREFLSFSKNRKGSVAESLRQPAPDRPPATLFERAGSRARTFAR